MLWKASSSGYFGKLETYGVVQTTQKVITIIELSSNEEWQKAGGLETENRMIWKAPIKKNK